MPPLTAQALPLKKRRCNCMKKVQKNQEFEEKSDAANTDWTEFARARFLASNHLYNNFS
jgi:hypothetical protein